MNTNWMAIVGAPALVAPLVLCSTTHGNHTNSTAHSGLVRVDALTPTPPNSAAPNSGAQMPADFDADGWKAQLRQRDLEAREHAFERLIEETRGNDAAQKQLEAWSQDDSNPDLAWTSRMALRELRVQSGSNSWTPRRPSLGSAQPWNDLRSRMDDLQNQFGGLDSMFEDLQRQMDHTFQGLPGPGRFAPSQPGQQGGFSNSESKSYSMQVDPDGVKVEVSQDVNGKKETQTFTAKTLDELYAAHPELRDQLGVHVGVQTGPQTMPHFGLNGGGVDPFGGARGLNRDDQDRPAIPLQPGAMRTDLLGVQISIPSADDRTQAKVDDGVGLKVENVQPGTIASKIGVQRGDLVVDVNGHSIQSVDDVRDTLRSRKDGEDVAVTVVDENGQKRVLTWRASSERRL